MDFDKVLEAPTPVVVDFKAEWCLPCKMCSPIIDALGVMYKDKIRVLKVDVDEEPAIAARYDIMSIPTVMFFKDGKVVDTLVGVMPQSLYQQRIDKMLESTSH